MRLTDIDKLSEHKFTRESAKSSDYMRGWNDCIDTIIDNAPTVEGEIEILTKEAYSDLCLRASRERPTGEWSDESKDSLLCSACGKRVYKPFIGGFPTERTSHYYPNFCAFCGADMRGGKQ